MFSSEPEVTTWPSVLPFSLIIFIIKLAPGGVEDHPQWPENQTIYSN